MGNCFFYMFKEWREFHTLNGAIAVLFTASLSDANGSPKVNDSNFPLPLMRLINRVSHKWEQWHLSRSSHHAISIFSISPFFFSVTSHCRKRLSCGALVISVCYLMVESWVGLNSTTRRTDPQPVPPGNSYPHLALTLQPVPLWNRLTVYQQYVIPATNAHTHTLSMWHTFCAYFHWHTQHIRTLPLRPGLPPPYTLIPIAESALCIHWLAGQLLKRERE